MIKDERSVPDKPRFSAFKRGWNEANKGKLYNSINNKKSHTNIGNLFGWIYGEGSEELKKKVWKQYIENNIKYLDKDW